MSFYTQTLVPPLTLNDPRALQGKGQRMPSARLTPPCVPPTSFGYVGQKSLSSFGKRLGVATVSLIPKPLIALIESRTLYVGQHLLMLKVTLNEVKQQPCEDSLKHYLKALQEVKLF